MKERALELVRYCQSLGERKRMLGRMLGLWRSLRATPGRDLSGGGGGRISCSCIGGRLSIGTSKQRVVLHLCGGNKVRGIALASS